MASAPRLSVCLLAALLPVVGLAEYVAFSINGIGDPTPTGAGYDFDLSGGPFSGVWTAEEDTTNGHSIVLTPDFLHSGESLVPSMDLPWRSSRPSMDSEGYDWHWHDWVTNFVGTVTGLSSGDVVTVFFLYEPWCDEVAVTIEGTQITTLNTTNEAAITPRLQQYGWPTNGVPGVARVFGCAVELRDTALDFELEPITASTSKAPVWVYGIVVDTQNDSRIDNDGDGSSDSDELLAGTDPFDAQSRLCITSFSTTSSGCSLSWLSVTGRWYSVLRGASIGEAFEPLAWNVAATPPVNAFTDREDQAQCAFYQLRVDVTTSAPPTVAHTLAVNSRDPDSGVGIKVSPQDAHGKNDGITGFTREYKEGLVVTLVAPLVAPNGRFFQYWMLDGVFFTSFRTANVSMLADVTMTAVYGPTTGKPLRVLTVLSETPATGVPIAINTSDLNGLTNGVTAFQRIYVDGTTVRLTAPLESTAGTGFEYWEMDGHFYTAYLEATVTMTNDTTMIAVFAHSAPDAGR